MRARAEMSGPFVFSARKAFPVATEAAFAYLSDSHAERFAAVEPFMPYRPRELVVRAREAAAILLATLDRNEMVPRFLDMYAAENRRPGRADQPAFYREQLQTIRRESILATVLRIEAALPARLKVSVTVRGAKPPVCARRKERQISNSRYLFWIFFARNFSWRLDSRSTGRTKTPKSFGMTWNCTRNFPPPIQDASLGAPGRQALLWTGWLCCSIPR
jgi:hypothetical protein